MRQCTHWSRATLLALWHMRLPLGSTLLSLSIFLSSSPKRHNISLFVLIFYFWILALSLICFPRHLGFTHLCLKLLSLAQCSCRLYQVGAHRHHGLTVHFPGLWLRKTWLSLSSYLSPFSWQSLRLPIDCPAGFLSHSMKIIHKFSSKSVLKFFY